ncbi:uncharacterized protein LOC112683898 [Sipha flava]|uniref:Uncharacterized protein LOC112683898 n=1 Tax=Sipha flava TaxID=143950 RepID=A0A8B8FIZ3_9HEMI|nr:uncharacterized protein LOC112683898 [Sipha flava]
MHLMSMVNKQLNFLFPYTPSFICHQIYDADVIRYAILPIGQLSEKAQESRNKDYKIYRQHHTRKNSRINTNEDLLHVLLILSDPLISTIKLLPKKKKKTYQMKLNRY